MTTRFINLVGTLEDLAGIEDKDGLGNENMDNRVSTEKLAFSDEINQILEDIK